PNLALTANYWNGTASTVDRWTISNQMGTGTNPVSTLMFAHPAGTTGAKRIAFPVGSMVIGAQNPGAGKLTVDGGNILVRREDADSALLLMTNSATSNPSVNFQRGRGDLTTGAYPNDGDILGSLGFRNSTDNTFNAAEIRSIASGNHSSGARGAALQFVVTPSGGTTNNPAVTMDSSGNVGVGTTAPNSTLHVSGSVATALAVRTASATLTSADSITIGNATSGPLTFTLPSAAGIAGRQYTIKKSDGSANAVTIATTSAQTIDGATTFPLPIAYQYATVVSDGANWSVIGTNAGVGVPSGAVMAFDLASCPTGWTAHAASQDRVLVGSGASYALNATGGANTGTTSSDGAHAHSGASGSTAITVAQMPSHNHGISDPGHAHSGTTDVQGAHAHGIQTFFTNNPTNDFVINDMNWDSIAGLDNAASGFWASKTTDSAGAHGHNLSINAAGTGISVQNNGSGAGHTHTIASDGAHTHTMDNRQPYLALLYCKKN
ncbi:MAG: hypothetical protein KF681_15145, partial [Bdellovibrionaceae bacterium]|nr:hypothetical protein [Pseudobdellovibrionaceae bacterium]